MTYSGSPNSYFKQLPDLDYPSLANDRKSAYDYQVVKNIFRRAIIRDDVFDEARYFKGGKEPCVFPTPIGGKLVKIGLQICEDMWDKDYDVKVSKSQMQLGADLLINISASPYQKDRLETRKEIIKEKVRETKLPFFYSILKNFPYLF